MAVTLAGDHRRVKAGVRIHRVAALHPTELRMRDGLRLTSAARTICDLAATEPRREVERALEAAIVARLSTEREIIAVLERNGNRPGADVVRAVLAVQQGPGFTRAESERALLKLLIRAADLPVPEKNARVDRFLVDFLWREARLVVEVDVYQFHGHRAAFERDRRRDQKLRATGYTVIRITFWALRDEPFGVVARPRPGTGAGSMRTA